MQQEFKAFYDDFKIMFVLCTVLINDESDHRNIISQKVNRLKKVKSGLGPLSEAGLDEKFLIQPDPDPQQYSHMYSTCRVADPDPH
jgi:hypothetical protein